MKKIFILILLYLFFPNDPWLHRFSGNEMTIDYQITIGHKLSSSEQKQIRELISTTFREIDAIYNKWNKESELSKLNQAKANVVIPLSAKLERFLFLTDEIVHLSGGKFDPTVEPLQQLWKKHLDQGEVPCEEEILRILPSIGWHHIHFGNGIFYKDSDETSLDLGGIAKGYCVDLLVERLVEKGFPNVLVEWGGEIRAHGKHPDQRPWRVMVNCLDDEDPEKAIAHIALNDQSIATSGDCFQYWKVCLDGVETTYSHIIDPLKAEPLIVKEESVASATIAAPTCALADALATVAMIHPSLSEANDWAAEIRTQNPEIGIWLYARPH